MRYMENYKEIEAWAKQFWEAEKINVTQIQSGRERAVVLDFFPYPSGVGLHIGHTLGYIATDVFARFERLRGKNVLYSMGFDSFGLPAEQFAIETGVHPEIITKQNIANMQNQLGLLGLSHDPTRIFSTTDPDYYKWTQWIFLQLYNSYFNEEENCARPIAELEGKLRESCKNEDDIYQKLKSQRLAYLAEVEVNWCPDLGTVLADEEVIGGKSERGGYPVFRKKLTQWMLRIAKYSKRLLEHLDVLDWPESVKEMQKNWIGVSNGVEISFQILGSQTSLKIFTTSPYTLFGATFCAISIKHPQIEELYQTLEAREFIEKFSQEYKDEQKEYGVFTGLYVINPLTNAQMPVYIADYVLPYGTFAVMGVPSHDERDCKFARKHGLNFIAVVKPDAEFLAENNIPGQYSAFTKRNALYSNRSVDEETERILSMPFARKMTCTKLRDWVFSRQRYWGEPFPIVLDQAGNAFALEESALPVELPYLSDFQTINSQEVTKPLDRVDGWKLVNFVKLNLHTARIVNAESGELVKINGKEYEVYAGTRETNTMPNWAGSCWYYLRYASPKCADAFVDPVVEKYWAGDSNKLGFVDLYLGGAEHAVLHLLYARFWHMILYDLGYVSMPEPFNRLFNQGMILGAAYQNEVGKYFAPSDVVKKNGVLYSKSTNEVLIESIGKIGKRYKNGVPPEEICALYGVDALRLYMMYLGPLEQSKPWDYSSIKGMCRLLDKICTLKIVQRDMSQKEMYDFGQMIKKMEKDYQALKFNTAISSFIIFLNSIESVNQEIYKKMLIALAPCAPHVCEYLYHNICTDSASIFTQPWPVAEYVELVRDSIDVVFTINGKKKCVESFSIDISEQALRKFALENFGEHKKIIIIKDNENCPKLVNIVVAMG